MELATQTVSNRRDAYFWRLIATAISFALFGMGCLCLRLVIFPVLSWLPGDAVRHRERARATVSRLFWLFIRTMARMGVLTYGCKAPSGSGAPGR